MFIYLGLALRCCGWRVRTVLGWVEGSCVYVCVRVCVCVCV